MPAPSPNTRSCSMIYPVKTPCARASRQVGRSSRSHILVSIPRAQGSRFSRQNVHPDREALIWFTVLASKHWDPPEPADG